MYVTTQGLGWGPGQGTVHIEGLGASDALMCMAPPTGCPDISGAWWMKPGYEAKRMFFINGANKGVASKTQSELDALAKSKKGYWGLAAQLKSCGGVLDPVTGCYISGGGAAGLFAKYKWPILGAGALVLGLVAFKFLK